GCLAWPIARPDNRINRRKDPVTTRKIFLVGSWYWTTFSMGRLRQTGWESRGKQRVLAGDAIFDIVANDLQGKREQTSSAQRMGNAGLCRGMSMSRRMTCRCVKTAALVLASYAVAAGAEAIGDVPGYLREYMDDATVYAGG